MRRKNPDLGVSVTDQSDVVCNTPGDNVGLAAQQAPACVGVLWRTRNASETGYGVLWKEGSSLNCERHGTLNVC